MKNTEVRLPQFAFPYKDPENPCPCQDRPINLTYKICQIFWLVGDGEHVDQGVAIAEIEAEKKTLELLAPASGILSYHVVDGEEVDMGALLAIITENVPVAS